MSSLFLNFLAFTLELFKTKCVGGEKKGSPVRSLGSSY